MSQPYNVAIIAGQLVVGGAEHQLYLWLSHMDREKFRPVVLTLHPGHGDHWESVIVSLNIPLLRVQQRPSQFLRLFDITRALRPYKPDLIQGWHLFASPYAGLAAKILGAKSLGGVRGSFKAFRNNFLEANLTLWLVDGIVVNSYSVAQQLKTVRKRKRQAIYTVQNAVDVQGGKRQSLRGELSKLYNIPSSSVWIGSLGRLDSGKRFDSLLDILSLVREENRLFHFFLIGDGPERAHLEEMVMTLGMLDCVTFTGEIPSAREWLNALDIFCFASMDEGLPNVIMEAAVAGLSIVAWRLPFMEELLVNGEGAIFTEPENPQDFKNALMELINHPTLRNKLGQSARTHMLRNYSLDHYIQGMTAVYQDILDIKER